VLDVNKQVCSKTALLVRIGDHRILHAQNFVQNLQTQLNSHRICNFTFFTTRLVHNLHYMSKYEALNTVADFAIMTLTKKVSNRIFTQCLKTVSQP